ncbi:unnamed protein product [Oikopleura dioica]|uniref:Uncharacterized protein n=1 Tax=Oikopleura dioica TaxID=34765 RepID=E4YCU0_OIKDI|nr:unnamed protein product [Oikopleura dioica]
MDQSVLSRNKIHDFAPQITLVNLMWAFSQPEDLLAYLDGSFDGQDGSSIDQ